MPKHQKKILQFIKSNIRAFGKSPTRKEIEAYTGLNPLVVHCAIHAMILRGVLGHNGARTRYLTIR
jgi:hypothetical protein